MTRVRGWVPSALTDSRKGGREGGAFPVSGPSTPCHIHSPAADTGVVSASSATVAANSLRCQPSRHRSLKDCAAVAADSSTAVEAKASATPGQGVVSSVADSDSGSRLTRMAMRMPKRATHQPTATSIRLRRSSRAHSAAATNPPVTHSGGVPGPPGESSSRASADSRGLTISERLIPASSSHSDGRRNSSSVHGSSSTSGVARLMARLTRRRRPTCPKATAMSTPVTRDSTHTNGTNAMSRARRRPSAQAARRDRRGLSVSTLVTSRPRTGKSAWTSAVPTRPCEIAPVATGSSA